MSAQIISMQKKMAMLTSLAALQTLNGKKMKPSKIEKIAVIIFVELLASLLAYSETASYLNGKKISITNHGRRDFSFYINI